MKKNGELKGLVLDLRGNPGGLLDQAAKVADKFLDDGADRRHGRQPERGARREGRARATGTEPNYPIVVLVNGSSARARARSSRARSRTTTAPSSSASTTFGKGSVQLVFTDLPDKAALKLTIAQYLTGRATSRSRASASRRTSSSIR